jgi:hypothetical protein
MVHTLRLDNYSPTPRKLVLGTNSSYGTESIKIERGAGWDELNLTATWHIPGREEPLRVALLDGDAMDVPPEVTKEAKDGVLVLAGLAPGVQRASCNVEYLILEQAGVYGGAGAEPTPELAAQVLEAALQAKADAEAAAEDAAAAKANADKAQADAEKAQQAAENAAADAAKAGPYAEAARAAQEAAESARDEAIAAQRAAQTAAKSAQDAQAAAEKVRDDAKTAQKGAEAARDTAAKSAEAAAKSEANAKQSADTLAESVENVVANTAAVAELKQQVKNITPDDSTIGGKPWSSKHIIDMLCPPLEESGNPVVCYPVAGYPLGVKASWEPMQEGTGTPSPENIRPIKGRDSVTVERCGENLLNIKPFNKDTYKGITHEYVPDGGIHISGTTQTSVDSPTFPVWQLPPGKYYGLDTGEGISASIVVQRNGKNLWLNAKGAFEILAGDVTKYWYTIVSAGATVDRTVYPYIVPGTNAPTTYTPYTGQTNTLTLPETVYGGEVDAVSGGGKETWKMLTLDGTEKWTFQTTNSPDKYGFVFQVPEIATPTIPEIKGDIVCSQYPTVSANDTYQCKNGISVEADNNHYFRIYNDTYAGGTTDEWKSHLANQYAAGTPVQVCYKLVEPIPFTATGAQPIPALAGVNTVLIDADSATVTGRADPIKRITDLEDAVASQT